jgi:hypothetical protein
MAGLLPLFYGTIAAEIQVIEGIADTVTVALLPNWCKHHGKFADCYRRVARIESSSFTESFVRFYV